MRVLPLVATALCICLGQSDVSDDQELDGAADDGHGVDAETFMAYIEKFHQGTPGGSFDLLDLFNEAAAESGDPSVATLAQLREFMPQADIELLSKWVRRPVEDVPEGPGATFVHYALQNVLGVCMLAAFALVLCVACTVSASSRDTGAIYASL